MVQGAQGSPGGEPGGGASSSPMGGDGGLSQGSGQVATEWAGQASSDDRLPWEGGPMPGGEDSGPSAPPGAAPPQAPPWPTGFLGAPPQAPQPQPPWGQQAPPEAYGQGWGNPQQPPGQVDLGLLNPDVMRAREEAEFQRFNAAYLNARTTGEQQAIDLAYKSRIQQLRLESREAQLSMREQQMHQRDAARSASDEPLYRNLYAERLAETYKVPKEKLLNHPTTNEPVWDARIMLNNALILAQTYRDQRVAARGAADAPYAPSGGQAGGQPDYMRMKDADFEAVFQDVLAGRRRIT